jgi:hypothetical protein
MMQHIVIHSIIAAWCQQSPGRPDRWTVWRGAGFVERHVRLFGSFAQQVGKAHPDDMAPAFVDGFQYPGAEGRHDEKCKQADPIRFQVNPANRD